MEQVMNFISLVWPFLILVGIMYFFMYRPQKKLKLERGRFLLSLRKGDHVVTAGGVHGVIKVLRDKYVELEIAPKVVIKVEKAAIQHGEVKLMDMEEAKKAGAAAIGEAATEPVENQMVKTKEKPDQVVEEVVEVDDPKDAGTEVVEEIVEVDENGKEISKTTKKEEKK